MGVPPWRPRAAELKAGGHGHGCRQRLRESMWRRFLDDWRVPTRRFRSVYDSQNGCRRVASTAAEGGCPQPCRTSGRHASAVRASAAPTAASGGPAAHCHRGPLCGWIMGVALVSRRCPRLAGVAADGAASQRLGRQGL